MVHIAPIHIRIPLSAVPAEFKTPEEKLQHVLATANQDLRSAITELMDHWGWTARQLFDNRSPHGDCYEFYFKGGDRFIADQHPNCRW